MLPDHNRSEAARLRDAHLLDQVGEFRSEARALETPCACVLLDPTLVSSEALQHRLGQRHLCAGGSGLGGCRIAPASRHGDLATEGPTVCTSLGIRNPCSDVFEWIRQSMIVVNRGKSRVRTRDMPHTTIPVDFSNRISRARLRGIRTSVDWCTTIRRAAPSLGATISRQPKRSPRPPTSHARVMNYPRERISLRDGAGGRNRTDTLSPEQDFESSVSTSSATPAYRRREKPSRPTPKFAPGTIPLCHAAHDLLVQPSIIKCPPACIFTMVLPVGIEPTPP